MSCRTGPGTYLGECAGQSGPVDLNPWKWSKLWVESGFFPRDSRTSNSSYLAYDIRTSTNYTAGGYKVPGGVFAELLFESTYFYLRRAIVRHFADDYREPFKAAQYGKDADALFTKFTNLKVGAPGGGPIRPRSDLKRVSKIRVMAEFAVRNDPDSEYFGIDEFGELSLFSANGGLGRVDFIADTKNAGVVRADLPPAYSSIKFTALRKTRHRNAYGPGEALVVLADRSLDAGSPAPGSKPEAYVTLSNQGKTSPGGPNLDDILEWRALDTAFEVYDQNDPDHRYAKIRLAIAWDWE